jgi:hypothetical protein
VALVESSLRGAQRRSNPVHDFWIASLRSGEIMPASSAL